MKKVLFTGASLLALSSASAQFYVNVSAGYGIAAPGEVLGQNTTITATGGSEENVYGTLGSGFQVGVTPGYFFTEHLGAELGVNYFFGAETDIQETTTPFGTAKVTAHSNQLRLVPSIVLRTGGESVYGYAKAGLIMPVAGSTITNLDDSGAGGPGSGSTAEYETKGRFATGFSGALGVNFAFGGNMGVFAEVGTTNLRVQWKERTLNEATVDGTDVLNMLSTYDRETEYKDEIDGNSNNADYNPNYSDGSAREELANRTNFGAMFITVGLRIGF
jgi:opacity protein-like surface antigen